LICGLQIRLIIGSGCPSEHPEQWGDTSSPYTQTQIASCLAMTKAQAKQTNRKIELKISPKVCDTSIFGTGSREIPFNNQLTPSKKMPNTKFRAWHFQ
jgi:hypothetical protein